MSVLAPFQLLEVNVISGQDLEPVCRKMRTYAVVWVHPERKLSTRVDTQGHTNPTWNDKFVFRVDDAFLYGDTSAVMIEIYALHWFRDIHVGTVRVLVGNLIPHPSRPQHHHYMQLGMRFVALQVRRQSGRPQGILNIGVALLDSSMRSMPLYMHMGSSAVGYKHLMGEEDPFQNHNNSTSTNNHNNLHPHGIIKPELRRTKSDTSSMIGSELRQRTRGSIINGSMINGSIVNSVEARKKGGSIVSGTEVEKKKGNSRGSSMISGSEITRAKGKKGKASSVVNAVEVVDSERNGNKNVEKNLEKEKEKTNENNEKHGSIVTGSEVVDPPKKWKGRKASGSTVNVPLDSGEPPKPPQKSTNEKNTAKVVVKSPAKSPPAKSPTKSFDKPFSKLSGLDFGSQYKFSKYNGFEYGLQKKTGAFWTDSELGPSPSEVAAAMAKNVYQRVDEGESSVAGGWSLDGSVEGLQSKLERWRTELPPLYDRSEFSSYESSVAAIPQTTKSGHSRRHTDGGGLFSCFSNICGCECSIVCGSGGPATSVRKKTKIRRTPSSIDNLSFL